MPAFRWLESASPNLAILPALYKVDVLIVKPTDGFTLIPFAILLLYTISTDDSVAMLPSLIPPTPVCGPIRPCINTISMPFTVFVLALVFSLVVIGVASVALHDIVSPLPLVDFTRCKSPLTITANLIFYPLSIVYRALSMDVQFSMPVFVPIFVLSLVSISVR